MLKHEYPMVIVPSAAKEKYLDALNKCDVKVGLNPSDGANATIDDIKPFVDYFYTLAERAIKTSIKAAKGENIDEQGDWKKKLTLLKNKKKNAPLYSLPLAKQVLENNFIRLIKKIDLESSDYYELFDDVQFVDNGNSAFDIKNLTESHFKVKPKVWCDFIFYNQYIISVTSSSRDLVSLEFSYGTTINDDIIKNIISEVGGVFAEFVHSNL